MEKTASRTNDSNTRNGVPMLWRPAPMHAIEIVPTRVVEEVLPVNDLLPEDRAYSHRCTLAVAYGELLRSSSWHWFLTLTFRPDRCGRTGGMHPEAADKAFRFFCSSINNEIYGKRWSKHPHRGIQWARGSEFHKDGRLHFHAVAASAGNNLSLLASRYEWHEFWFREFGRNQIEVPRSQDEISGYVSKYVAKGGEVDFSKNFGAWKPPVQRFESAPVQNEFAGTRQIAPAPKVAVISGLGKFSRSPEART